MLLKDRDITQKYILAYSLYFIIEGVLGLFNTEL
jgi:hypothetical protein